MTTTSLTLQSRTKSFGGWVEVYSHDSDACGCPMTFAVYKPPQIEDAPVPVLTWLSGLTCTHENFITKAGAQQFAADKGLLLVVPDTSPRGVGIEGEDDAYDFGSGAGFYLNATESPWSTNYNMYDYIVSELPAAISANFSIQPECESIFGHSMGGHGALTIALKNPGRYRSVSAFAPICAPTQCPWGHKAFSGYLGDDQESWLQYDANHLIQQNAERLPMLIDQGADDGFLAEQLHFETFKETCSTIGYPVTARLQPDYDHSYYFIASFMEEHVAHHAAALNGG
ncbi:MAG: S-formylglutathione hydrolase [Chloroflexota bacterium]